MGGVLLFMIFPLVKEIRNIGGEDRLSFGFLIDAFYSIDNPVVKIISEIGGSMRTIAYTLTLVPDSRPFDMGEGYLILFPYYHAKSLLGYPPNDCSGPSM